jgi:hypothetical protein
MRKCEDIIKSDHNELGFKLWTGLSTSGKDPMANFCEHGDEPSGFTKAENFLIGRTSIGFSVTIVKYEAG